MSKKQQDRNFDGIAGKFQKNIYQTTKGRLRQAVLLRDFAECADLATPSRILDVGAGQGQLALALAEQGHQVTLTDLSQDMLDMALEDAQERGVDTQIQCHALALQQLSEQQWPAFPVVLCHAVLEWLHEPAEAIKQLRALVQTGGLVSLMFYNKDAKRFGNILFGNFDYVAADFQVKKKVSLNPQHPLVPQDVLQWCAQAGFSLLGKTGVRCFHDYLRDRSEQETEFDKLLEVELKYNRTEPYASLGRYQHLLLLKPVLKPV